VIRVHLVGAIRQPGVYSLPASARVLDGITLAGGATSRADLDRINLADFLKDGEQVRVPVLGGTEAAGAHRPTAEPAFVPAGAGGKAKGRYPFASSPTTGTSARGASGSGRVHLNAAGKADLERLPGVGPATAARILAYRSQYGPFERVEDLMNVTGIGRKRLEEMRPLLAVP
jgi:competence protein ComEA